LSRESFKTVLLIEGNTEETQLIREMIQQLGSHAFELAHVGSVGDAEAYLAEHHADVILLDLESAGVQGMEALRRVCEAAPRVAIVVLLSLAGEPMAKQAIQDGAQDYLIKGEIQARELVRALENAIERKAIEEALFEAKERAQVTLDSIGDAVISADAEGKITFLNLMAERLTGWPEPEANGQRMDEVFRIVDAATRQVIPNPMEDAVTLNRVGHLPGNCILIRRDGHEIFIEDSAAPIHNRGGGVTGSVIVFRDVSTARALAEETVHASQHDFLTGMPNRLLLNDRLGQAIALAKRRATDVAVLFMDLDGFKHINDSLGHLIGDKLLQSIAKRLTEQIRTPSAGRVGTSLWCFCKI
jgi:PAS domain S-box-containing protein